MCALLPQPGSAPGDRRPRVAGCIRYPGTGLWSGGRAPGRATWRGEGDDVGARPDLLTIRRTLLAALDAGCDDLVTCAGSPDCPLPFVELAADEPSRPTVQPDASG